MSLDAPDMQDPQAITPVRMCEDRNVWVKRDDLFNRNGARGGKARSADLLMEGETRGVTTVGHRKSPQAGYIGLLAQRRGIKAVCVTAQGAETPEMEFARGLGVELVQVNPGYGSYCAYQARKIADERGYSMLPMGLESEEAFKSNLAQAVNIPPGVRRVLLVLGSGMTLAGVYHGMNLMSHIPIWAVCVGNVPLMRIKRWLPEDWEKRVTVVHSKGPYDRPAKYHHLEDLNLDPHYEAKCLPFLREGDLLWVVGIRPTLDPRG